MKKWARKTGCLGRQDEKVPTDNSIPNWPRFFKKERAFRSWLSDAGPSAVHREARPMGAHDQRHVEEGTQDRGVSTFSVMCECKVYVYAKFRELQCENAR